MLYDYYQPMAFVQLAGESLDQIALSHVLHAGDNLCDEVIAHDAADAQRLVQIVRQPPDTLLDHAFDTRRQCVPVQRRAWHPAPVGILHQVTALLQVTQQFDREERVPVGACEQL